MTWTWRCGGDLPRIGRSVMSGTVSRTPSEPSSPALLGPQTRVIDFTSSKMIADNTKKGKAIMRSVYEVMDRKCPNLDTLVMGQSFIFMPELVRDLNTKLTHLTRLVVLKLMYIAHDPMMTDIASLCPRIREMSLKGSSHITDVAAEEISRLKQLSVLDI